MTDHNPAIGHLSLSFFILFTSIAIKVKLEGEHALVYSRSYFCLRLMCTCIFFFFFKKNITIHIVILLEKNENHDKDGQSGIFMPFGVKKQNSTLAAYLAIKKINVDVALLHTVIKR